LKEILDELKKLNQKLDVDREGVRRDVEGKGLDREGAIPQLEAGGRVLSTKITEGDLKDEQASDGVGDARASQALMSGGFGAGKSPNPDGDHGSAEGAGDEMDMPATAPSQALGGNNPNAVSSEPGVEGSSTEGEKEVTYRYHWKLPAYGGTDEDYPGPSEDQKNKWTELLQHNWGIPNDGRLPLTLQTKYLMHVGDEAADGILQTVQDYLKNLRDNGSRYSRFTVDDYIAPGRCGRLYFGQRGNDYHFELPNEDIIPKWNVDQYPSLDDAKDSPAPWRRFM
jgi:hypothetical protein